MFSAGLVTSKSNALQLLSSKVTSYLFSYFLKIVTSYFTSYYKLTLLHHHSNILLLLQVEKTVIMKSALTYTL